MVQKNPLDPDCPWESEDGSESLSTDAVAAEMASIGAELSVLQISKTVSRSKLLLFCLHSKKKKIERHYCSHCSTLTYTIFQNFEFHEN